VFYGGVDCSSFGNSGVMVGAAAVWNRIENRLVDYATALTLADFPYVPGLLAFRELPAILAAFRGLKTLPDVIICDGQGTAHTRGFGIACHLGLYLELPTIGCGKSRLVGTYSPPGNDKGAQSTLSYKSLEIGRVVRTRSGVAPVFVSPGHRCGFDRAVEITLSACTRFRLPEPVRAAHNLSRHALRQLMDREVR